MEMGKKTILIPNEQLKDGHQNDICNYAKNNNYAYVLNNVEEIENILNTIEVHKFDTYKRDEVKIAKYIHDLIIEDYK